MPSNSSVLLWLQLVKLFSAKVIKFCSPFESKKNNNSQYLSVLYLLQLSRHNYSKKIFDEQPELNYQDKPILTEK